VSLLQLESVGKAYSDYGSEWRRVAAILGCGFKPRSQHWVLEDVNFTLGAGESLGIVGRNGAGKSTLLKMIAGTVQPTSGALHWHGSPRVAAILELGLGFLPDFTGRENARHSAELMGIPRATIDELLPGIAEFADIGDYFDQPVRTYSTGMSTRVAFATVTALRPDLLIVDEALSVGDAYFQAKCFERIARFRREGMALILVSHAIGDVIAHCDRALLLSAGRVRADARPAEVTNLYYEELFASGVPRATASQVPPEQDSQFHEGGSDCFASRPGYRKEEHCWGDGGAVILDYHISAGGQAYPAEIDSGATVEFAFKVRFSADFSHVVPGFLLKTLDGQFVFGSNAHVAAGGLAAPLAVRAGELHIFRFRLPLSVNAGDYLVSFGVADGAPDQAQTPLQRRYDAVIIHVQRRVPFWGLVDLGAQFEHHNLESA
jgi:lipopolysaccharide transport system ATP-binding protein